MAATRATNGATGLPLTLSALPIALLVVAASGCGSGIFGMGEHHQQMHGAGGGAPQTPLSSDASEIAVDIADFDFSPRDLTIRSGTAVTWTNRDSAPHDATDEAGGWGTGLLDQGQDATLTFGSPGFYAYLCTIHPDMKATLTVE